jgi:hypothetical protein
MTGAERTRLHRQRRRAGVVVLRIAVEIGSVADFLAEAGLLREWDIEDRDAVARAIERMLERAPDMAG